MRIVGGALGGRRLAAPRGPATRPTPERVREALFSILGDRVRGARVLDLFAGSGLLGFEAVSRGASEAVLVDRSRAALDVLRTNRRTLEESIGELGARVAVVEGDALAFLREAGGASSTYDLVFLDPPYAHAARLAARLADLLPGVLAPGATVVVESDRRSPLDLDLPLHDERRYGDTLIRLHGPR